MKVSELKKSLAPICKGPLKAIAMPFEAGGSTHYMPGKSWHRDVKSDEKKRLLVLNHVADTVNPHAAETTRKLKAFVERVNEIIAQQLPDCDIRMEFREVSFSVDVADSPLRIQSGEVIN